MNEITETIHEAAPTYVTWGTLPEPGPQRAWVESLVAEIVAAWEEINAETNWLAIHKSGYKACVQVRRERLAEIVRRHAGLRGDEAAR